MTKNAIPKNIRRPPPLLCAWLGAALFILICLPSQAQTNLSAYQEYNLALQTSFLIEEKQTYDYSQIKQLKSDAWTKNKNKKMNFGFTEKPIWLKGSMTTSLKKETIWLFNVEYPPLDNIWIYISINGELIDTIKSGDAQPFSQRPISSKEYLYRLSLKPGDQVDYILRIQTAGSMQVPIHITPINIYIKKTQIKQMFISALYGILLVMGLYNMFISILIKDKDYAIYVLWVFSSLLFVFALNGEGFQLLWPNLPIINNFAIPVSFGFSGFFNSLFALKFMKIEQNRPFISKVFYILLTLYLLSIAISTLGNYSTSIRIIFLVNFITLIFLAISTIYLVIKKQQGARIFLLTFTILLISAIVLSLSTADIIPSSFISTHANQLAMVLESIIFSLALAKKIDYEKSLRIEKEREVSVVTKVANDNLNLYTELFNNSPISIFRFLKSGDIISSNPAFKNMFTADDGKALGNICPLLFPKKNELASILSKLDPANIFSAELRIHTADKIDNWISLTVIGYQDEHSQQPIYEGHALDITQKKKTEIKNKQLEEQKSKMLSRLVSGIAHEINTPVGTNITAISLLECELKQLNDEFEMNSITKDGFSEFITSSNSILEILNRNEYRTALLVKRFKEVSIDQLAFTRSRFDIYHTLHEHLTLNPIDHCQITFKKPEQAIEINSYKKAFILIIDKLIDNSIKYKESEIANIQISLSCIGDCIHLNYTDDGPGVTEDIRELIFEPFYTSSPGDADSTGLGLFVIYNLCKQLLHSEIELKPQPGFNLHVSFPNSVDS